MQTYNQRVFERLYAPLDGSERAVTALRSQLYEIYLGLDRCDVSLILSLGVGSLRLNERWIRFMNHKDPEVTGLKGQCSFLMRLAINIRSKDGEVYTVCNMWYVGVNVYVAH